MSATPPPDTAAAVIIGNEILSGKIVDENGPHLLRTMRELGVETRRVEVVPDEIDLIVDALHRCLHSAAHVFTSGGVGPTHDDVTIEAVARALGVRVVRHPELESLLRGFYGEKINDARLRLAEIPEGAELLWGDGQTLRYPAVLARNVLVLPGVPLLFRDKLDQVRERYRAEPISLQNLFLSEGEGAIAALLIEATDRFPHVAIGSYPRFDETDHKVKVTIESRDESAVEACTRFLRARLGTAVLRESRGLTGQ